MITGICGTDFGYNMGNLKTYTMTQIGVLDRLQGRKIFANYSLSIPYTPIKSFEQLIEVMETEGYNITILLDEISVYFDAYDRPSKKDGSKDFKNFVRQTRKRGVKLYYTAQSFWDINLSIRRVTHRILLTQKYDITRDGLLLCQSDRCYKPHVVEITDCKPYRDDVIPKREPIYLPVNIKIFDMYNSEELIGLS